MPARAGRARAFHNARAQLSRFLNGFGGFVSQVTNHSFGAAMVIVPHVVGTMEPVAVGLTSLPTIAGHTKLMVLFGGMAQKNTQVTWVGSRHEDADWLAQLRAAGVSFVNISPLRDDAAESLGATGAWFDPLDPAEIGSLDKHGNPNVLTLDKGTSKLAQCCFAQTALVEVERFDGEAPPVTAFSVPAVAPR
jgi:anaerobic selenocysteine-containing dehydrogenase